MDTQEGRLFPKNRPSPIGFRQIVLSGNSYIRFKISVRFVAYSDGEITSAFLNSSNCFSSLAIFSLSGEALLLVRASGGRRTPARAAAVLAQTYWQLPHEKAPFPSSRFVKLSNKSKKSSHPPAVIKIRNPWNSHSALLRLRVYRTS